MGRGEQGTGAGAGLGAGAGMWEETGVETGGGAAGAGAAGAGAEAGARTEAVIADDGLGHASVRSWLDAVIPSATSETSIFTFSFGLL